MTAHDQARAQYESIAALTAAYELDYDEIESLQDTVNDLEQTIETVQDEREEAYDTLRAIPHGREHDAEREAAAEAVRALEARNDDLCLELAHANEDLAELQAIAAAYDTTHPFTSQDEVFERIQEQPLCVETRSDWADPWETPTPAEFRILLCTGGPAVQILGELDQYQQPCRAWLEYQDWGTPWTQFYDADQDVLRAFCQCFYFGR